MYTSNCNPIDNSNHCWKLMIPAIIQPLHIYSHWLMKRVETFIAEMITAEDIPLIFMCCGCQESILIIVMMVLVINACCLSTLTRTPRATFLIFYTSQLFNWESAIINTSFSDRLTHWPLEDVAVISSVNISNTTLWLICWVLNKHYQCQRTSLLVSQHWITFSTYHVNPTCDISHRG